MLRLQLAYTEAVIGGRTSHLTMLPFHVTGDCNHNVYTFFVISFYRNHTLAAITTTTCLQ